MKFPVRNTVVLLIALLSVASFATDRAYSLDPGWREKTKAQLVARICKDGGEWVAKCFNRKPSECSEIIGKTIGACLDSHGADIQQSKDAKAIDSRTNELTQCITRTFVAYYGSAKNTPECQTTPEFMR